MKLVTAIWEFVILFFLLSWMAKIFCTKLKNFPFSPSGMSVGMARANGDPQPLKPSSSLSRKCHVGTHKGKSLKLPVPTASSCPVCLVEREAFF